MHIDACFYRHFTQIVRHVIAIHSVGRIAVKVTSRLIMATFSFLVSLAQEPHDSVELLAKQDTSEFPPVHLKHRIGYLLLFDSNYCNSYIHLIRCLPNGNTLFFYQCNRRPLNGVETCRLYTYRQPHRSSPFLSLLPSKDLLQCRNV
jgi:hypothetical protein